MGRNKKDQAEFSNRIKIINLSKNKDPQNPEQHKRFNNINCNGNIIIIIDYIDRPGDGLSIAETLFSS